MPVLPNSPLAPRHPSPGHPCCTPVILLLGSLLGRVLPRCSCGGCLLQRPFPVGCGEETAWMGKACIACSLWLHLLWHRGILNQEPYRYPLLPSGGERQERRSEMLPPRTCLCPLMMVVRAFVWLPQAWVIPVRAPAKAGSKAHLWDGNSGRENFVTNYNTKVIPSFLSGMFRDCWGQKAGFLPRSHGCPPCKRGIPQPRQKRTNFLRWIPIPIPRNNRPFPKDVCCPNTSSDGLLPGGMAPTALLRPAR